MVTKIPGKPTVVKVAQGNKIHSTVKLRAVTHYARKHISESMNIIKEFRPKIKRSRASVTMFSKLTQNFKDTEGKVVKVLEHDVLPTLKFCGNSAYVLNRIKSNPDTATTSLSVDSSLITPSPKVAERSITKYRHL